MGAGGRSYATGRHRVLGWHQPIAIELGARETERQKALRAAGVVVHRFAAATFDRMGDVLRDRFHRPWDGETLPSSSIPPDYPAVGTRRGVCRLTPRMRCPNIRRAEQ